MEPVVGYLAEEAADYFGLEVEDLEGDEQVTNRWTGLQIELLQRGCDGEDVFVGGLLFADDGVGQPELLMEPCYQFEWG